MPHHRSMRLSITDGEGEGAELVANGVPSVAWNHVRTIAPMVSAILFTAALCLA